VLDWAAYSGGTSEDGDRQAVREALRSGNKLRIEDAAYYFPGLPIIRYRE